MLLLMFLAPSLSFFFFSTCNGFKISFNILDLNAYEQIRESVYFRCLEMLWMVLKVQISCVVS